MQYLLKKISTVTRENGLLISDLESATVNRPFWTPNVILDFGRKPKINIGDQVIVEVSSCKKAQQHAIVGVFEIASNEWIDSIGPYVDEHEQYKWRYAIHCKNLTIHYSNQVKNLWDKLNPNPKDNPSLFYLDKLWASHELGRIPYHGQGWAYASPQQAQKIINDILAKDIEISQNSN